MSHNQRSRVNIIVWGLHKELTTLEVRAKSADMGLESFVRGNVLWEGDHIRLVLTIVANFSTGYSGTVIFDHAP